MSKRKLAGTTVVAADLKEGATILLEDGTTAIVRNITDTTHIITEHVTVKVVSYEVSDGKNRGFKAAKPMFVTDELEVYVSPAEKRARMWAWFKAWFTN